MFEHRTEALLPLRHFLSRAFLFALFSLAVIAASLFLGMAGYHYIAGIGWVDSFYNASMILTGMGPGLDIEQLPEARRDNVKIFAGMYALYSGLVFLATTGLILSPLIHRFFHKMHLDIRD